MAERPEDGCPIAGTLALLRDRWSWLILRDCFYGVRRFESFRRHLGISRRVLSERLAALVAAGILRKVPYQQKPARFEYRLTAKGRELFPVLAAMAGWGNRWLAAPEGPALRLRHLDCGHAAEGRFVCEHCGGRMSLARVRAEAGPGADREAVQRLADAVRPPRRSQRSDGDSSQV